VTGAEQLVTKARRDVGFKSSFAACRHPLRGFK
jgi:hypothetical protein